MEACLEGVGRRREALRFSSCAFSCDVCELQAGVLLSEEPGATCVPVSSWATSQGYDVYVHRLSSLAKMVPQGGDFVHVPVSVAGVEFSAIFRPGKAEAELWSLAWHGVLLLTRGPCVGPALRTRLNLAQSCLLGTRHTVHSQDYVSDGEVGKLRPFDVHRTRHSFYLS